MARIARFEEIEAWRQAREATRLIYEISARGEFAKDFALTNQIRRATISVMSNIAEGFERQGNREFLNFLSIAKGSCAEVRAQLYVALDQRYVTEDEFHEVYSRVDETGRLIGGFMRYLKSTEMRGSKYAEPKVANDQL